MTSSPSFTDDEPRSGDLGYVLDRVLDTARVTDFEGSSKHDALNARWLERLAGNSRPRRLVATQPVMRSPIDVRSLVGVTQGPQRQGPLAVRPGAALPPPHDRSKEPTPRRPGTSSTG